MKKLIMAILLSVAVPAIAQAKPATCLLEEDGKMLYKGKCNFNAEKGGSFWLSHPNIEKELDLESIAVWIDYKDHATVNVAKVSGGAIEWGKFVRSQKQKACWVNDWYKICAWAQ